MRLQAPVRPEYAVRAVRANDVAAFCALRDLAGAGFTSLAIDDKSVAKRIDHAAASFAETPKAPGGERYLMALEHLETGVLVGCAGLKSTIGDDPPFFNFRHLTVAQASHAAARRFDMGVLILVNEFTGSSEVGTLFLMPAHRAGGVGRVLAQTRYMLLAAAPERFNERVVSEMRGVVSPEGVSPFWEALGRHFFQMDFHEADRLSATTDNQFILDLMPKYPIYVDLLPNAARDVIGQCHPDGAGARRMLEWEGFRFDNVVDIFDAGPLLSVSREAIRTRREARAMTLRVDDAASETMPALIATTRIAAFRSVAVAAQARGDDLHVHSAALRALGADSGESVIAWISDAP